MKEASRQINRDKIQHKVMKMTPNQLADQQNNKIKSLLDHDAKSADKMKYYDSLLNLERKCNHFNKLFLKHRLKVIHKPFIILDMLKILDDNRSPFDLFMCLYIRLRNTKKRTGFDSIRKFVEHKNELVDTWVYFAERLIDREKRNRIKEIKARKREEKVEIDKSKIMKRSLTFLFSVVGNFVRRNMRDGLKHIKLKSDKLAEKERGQPTEKETKKEKKPFAIAAQELFFIEKIEKKKVEPEIQIVEVAVKANPKQFEVENTNNLFHHVTERRGQMNAYLESKTHVDLEDDKDEASGNFEEEESEKNARIQQEQMLGEINQQIKFIRSKLLMKPGNQMLTLDEEIDLLNQLTKLLGLLKNYYEYIMNNPKFRDSKQTRKNFEQIMELTKKIIDKLLLRIEEENQKRQNESSKNTNDFNSPVEERKRQSLLQIDSLNQNLKRELEELENFLDFKTNENLPEESQGESSKDDCPDANGINTLLQEMLSNLGQMNNTMQNQQNVVQEEDEPEDENYTQCKKISYIFLSEYIVYTISLFF
jgi:hypothetical protein